MLPPNELKKKNFTRVMRGYSSAEVDEYINFLMEQYTDLYRENNDLECKLRNTAAKLDALKKDEESIDPHWSTRSVRAAPSSRRRTSAPKRLCR